LTFASKDHPGLLFHTDIMGGARLPKPGERDQRAYLPRGRFAVVLTKALRTPEAMCAFHDVVRDAVDLESTGFAIIQVGDPAQADMRAGSDLVLDEQKVRDAAAAMLRGRGAAP
jgi:hypothetical protein